MMTMATARLALPLLEAGQAQKETTHNEALARLDIAVQPCVETGPIDLPPSAPAAGEAWIVGAAPVGDWSGRAGSIAGWTTSGWRFVVPLAGMAAWRRDNGLVLRFADGAWAEGIVVATRVVIDGEPVIGARRPAIADPAGGTVIDTPARAAISAILAALRHHGLIAG